MDLEYFLSLPIEFNIGWVINSPRSYLRNVGHLRDDIGSDRKPPSKMPTNRKWKTSVVGMSVEMKFCSEIMTSFDRKSPGRVNLLQ